MTQFIIEYHRLYMFSPSTNQEAYQKSELIITNGLPRDNDQYCTKLPLDVLIEQFQDITAEKSFETDTKTILRFNTIDSLKNPEDFPNNFPISVDAL